MAVAPLDIINWPEELADSYAYANFAATVAQSLYKKDYSVIQVQLPDELSSKALAEASSSEIRYTSLKSEFQKTFLGRDAQAKVHWIQGDEDDKPPETALEQCDAYFTQLCLLLEPVTPALFSFQSASRTGAMLRRPYDSAQEEAQMRPLPLDEDDVEDGLVDSHIMFCRRRQLCTLLVVGGSGGTLTLFPQDGEPIPLSLTKGSLAIFRTAKLSYSYQPVSNSDDLVLLSWLLAKPPGIAPGSIMGTGAGKDALLGLVNGIGTPKGNQINVLVMEPGLPAGCHNEGERYWAAMAGGCDGYTKVPRDRFDIDEYYIDYESGHWTLGYSYSCHAGFCIEDIYALDNDFFNISPEEAVIMSPDAKMVMQHGYSCLYKGGHTRKSLMGKSCALFAAHSGNDWSGDWRFTMGSSDVYRMGYRNREWSNMFCRIQYQLGMMGPCMQVDTACSSALVCYAVAHSSMRKSEGGQEQSAITSCLQEAMVISANMIPGQGSFVALSGPHMLSATGRCFTFDRTANGFTRAEGTGCFYVGMQAEFNEDAMAIVIGACTNQDGRSASMTAPNGPAQQECIRGSMKEAGLDANDVTCAECHGTGTALGDPIEVGALKGVMKNRVVPLIESSAKAHIGHAECTAGMAGVMKCLVMCAAAAGTPSPHLVALNGHLDVTGYPTLFCTELVSYESNASVTGVSSFGWGGANGRADVWSPCRKGVHKVKFTREIDFKLLDYIAVTCPVDGGPINFIDGRVISAPGSRKYKKGPYRAAALRDEYDTYDYSSFVYEGKSKYGYQLEEDDDDFEPPDEPLFIVGSWSSGQMEEMEYGKNGEYTFSVVLGDTRREQFHIVVDGDASQMIYPVVPCGTERSRILGPDTGGEEKFGIKQKKNWVIDGRDAEVPAGTVYKVTFRWSDPMSISWVRTDTVAKDKMSTHDYYVRGTFTSGQTRAMVKLSDPPNTWQFQVKVGANGRESFQFLRDDDPTQLIYPNQDAPDSLDVPVRGPDAFGQQKKFFFDGMPSEILKLKLTVDDAHLRVEMACGSTVKVWESIDGPGRHEYFIVGLSEGAGVRMEPIAEKSGAFRYRGTTQREREVFSILIDGEESLTYYPISAGETPGQCLVCGPDEGGSGVHFGFNCWRLGIEYEIILDLEAVDRRKVVELKWLADPVDFDVMRDQIVYAFETGDM